MTKPSDKNTQKIPQLRFPGFSGEWEEKRLGDVATFSKGKNISKADITESGTECIRYGELYTHYRETIDKVISRTNIDKSFLVLSEKNDLIIPASGETAIDISTACCILKEGIAIGGDINIIKSKQNGIFMAYYLSNGKKLDIANLAQGISVIHLYSKQLATLDLYLPTLPEQQRIADFLSEIDTKIEKLSRKKELMTEYKKGVMQKIFSQEIRFKDENGNDYPDWQEKRLGEVGNITTGKLDANAMKENGQFRFYTCAKEYFWIDEFAFDTEALLVSGNGANVGYVHYYRGKFNAYQRTYVLDDFNENIIYIKYLLDKHLKKRIHQEKNEGNTPYITIGTLSEMKMELPCLEEQKKISDFLVDLDSKIEHIHKELTVLKEFKKGLLQKMFV